MSFSVFFACGTRSFNALLFGIAAFTVFQVGLYAQNPHGTALKYDCKACHTAGSWSYSANNDLFDHQKTAFALEGQHESAACKACHTDLVFEVATSSCVACHTDVHSMSIGNDCARCHTPENWLVDNIPELHEANGFPLIGGHTMTACTDCHKSETNLRWERIGNECSLCHLDDYYATQTDPGITYKHVDEGFSTNCTECHDPFAPEWKYATFFGHGRAGSFPIQSGNHGPGVWNDCSDCHIVQGDFSIFSCIDCHEHDDPGRLADKHRGEAGYQYNSIACLKCHPRGTEE